MRVRGFKLPIFHQKQGSLNQVSYIRAESLPSLPPPYLLKVSGECSSVAIYIIIIIIIIIYITGKVGKRP